METPPSSLLRGGPVGTLRTYRAHHLGPHPLDEPGQTDITADVNFTALLAVGHRRGLDCELVRQDDFLTRFGLRDRLAALRARELDLARGDDTMGASGFAARSVRWRRFFTRGGWEISACSSVASDEREPSAAIERLSNVMKNDRSRTSTLYLALAAVAIVVVSAACGSDAGLGESEATAPTRSSNLSSSRSISPTLWILRIWISMVANW